MKNDECKNVIAILLVGGQGARLGNTSRFVPKPLINIGVQPVINQIIEKLLSIDNVTTIYILSRRTQMPINPTNMSEKGMDLGSWFTRWKDVWYSDERGFDKVKLVFEEDVPNPDVAGYGAILGLYRLLLWMQSGTPLLNQDGNVILEPHLWDSRDHFLVCAADNFWEDNLSGLMEEMRHYPNSIINAYYDFGNIEKIRNKYGAIKVRDGWIVDYEEKPLEPAPDQTKASTAIYVYPSKNFEGIREYIQQDRDKYPLDSPGNLIKWYVKSNHYAEKSMLEGTQTDGVRAYKLLGHWYDIGNKSDLMTAIIWFTRKTVSSLKTVEDLKLVEQTEDINDQYYFLCHQLEVDTINRRISIYFKDNDSICKLSPDDSFERVPSVREIRDQFRKLIDPSSHQENNYWPALNRAFQGEESFPRQRLASPLLISGGVFLLDSTPPTWREDHHRLTRARPLLPLFERGAGAPTDAGRLTSPAGRMDILDLFQASFNELAEEMIFYGADRETDRTTIYCCAPPELRNVKQKVLRRILGKNIQIPEIDTDRIREQAKRSSDEIDLVKIIDPATTILPKSRAWSVEIFLEDERQSSCENVILIPDVMNATLEFRFMCTANITDLGPIASYTKSGRRVGKLMGIADGEGYRNRCFLFEISKICDYYNELQSKDSKAILDYLFQSQHDLATALAVTDGQTGRFAQLDAKMPVLTFTTSVRYLIELLNELY